SAATSGSATGAIPPSCPLCAPAGSQVSPIQRRRRRRRCSHHSEIAASRCFGWTSKPSTSSARTAAAVVSSGGLGNDRGGTTPRREAAMTHDTTEELTHLRLAAELSGLAAVDLALPTTHHVVLHGFRLHYLDWGTQGELPIVFLHGGALTARTWDLV